MSAKRKPRASTWKLSGRWSGSKTVAELSGEVPEELAAKICSPFVRCYDREMRATYEGRKPEPRSLRITIHLP